MMTLGSNIQKIRREAHLSQEEFAEMFQVTRQTISNWENSKSYPDLETIIKISNRFEISLDILLKEDIIMVKTFDNEVKSTRKYARALIAMAMVFTLLIGGFAIYSIVYFNTKSNVENHFQAQLEENNGHKNTRGCYSVDYGSGVVYDIPKPAMPELLEFSLRPEETSLYCYIDNDEATVHIMWEDENEYIASATSKKDHMIIGSTAELQKTDRTNMKELGAELGISEKELREIIEKGNGLYKDFYSQN